MAIDQKNYDPALMYGATHIKVTTNATTTGGGIGGWMRFVCTSATKWTVTGVINSPSGTIATPFST